MLGGQNADETRGVVLFFWSGPQLWGILRASFYFTDQTEGMTRVNVEMFSNFLSCVFFFLLSNQPTFLCSFYVYCPPPHTWRHTQTQKNPLFFSLPLLPASASRSLSGCILKQAASTAARLEMIGSSEYSVVNLLWLTGTSQPVQGWEGERERRKGVCMSLGDGGNHFLCLAL